MMTEPDIQQTFSAEEIVFRMADGNDLDAVSELYRSAIGTEGCTWNEYYPTRDDAAFDISENCLFVLTHKDKIIGAASIVPENELDSLEMWKIEAQAPKEIARVVVSSEYRGNALGERVVRGVTSVLKERKCDCVRLLAAKVNKAAIKTYKNIGFSFVGETFMYENDYFACEMKI